MEAHQPGDDGDATTTGAEEEDQGGREQPRQAGGDIASAMARAARCRRSAASSTSRFASVWWRACRLPTQEDVAPQREESAPPFADRLERHGAGAKTAAAEDKHLRHQSV